MDDHIDEAGDNEKGQITEDLRGAFRPPRRWLFLRSFLRLIRAWEASPVIRHTQIPTPEMQGSPAKSGSLKDSFSLPVPAPQLTTLRVFPLPAIATEGGFFVA